MDLVPYSRMTWDDPHQARQVARLRAAALFPVILLALTTSALQARDVLQEPLYAGACFLVVATLLSLTPAYDRFDQPTMLAIALLDIGGVVAIASVPGAAVAGALVVVPGLWLGGVFRWRGAGLAAALGVTAMATTEVLSRSGQTEAGAERTYWIIAFGVVAAVAMASTVTVWVGQVALLGEQRAELALTLSQLEEREDYIATIVRTVDVGLASLGTDGTYVSLNPRHVELLSLAYPDGHAGRAGELGKVFGADNRTRLDHERLPSVRAVAGETFTDTIWIGQETATRRAIAVSGRPLIGHDGVRTGAVLVSHDITDHMRALRAKDDFVAMMSHELRTPLTAIIASLELAADVGDDNADKLPHLLAMANRNADRMLHLVADLLSVSQQVSPHGSRESVALSEVVGQSVEDAADQARRGGVEVTTDIEPGLRTRGDRAQLLQLTDNLLSNAVKYTPSGGKVLVTLCRASTDTVLSVRDTGIGVSADDQGEVFTEFFRGRSCAGLQLPGIGLGLSVSRTIVEAHGGSIRLTSRPGVGTAVLVRLPAGSPTAMC